MKHEDEVVLLLPPYRKLYMPIYLTIHMKKIDSTEVLYRIFLEYKKIPRIHPNQLHRLHSPYKAKATTANLITTARKNRVLIGPYLYCNSGISCELYDSVEDPLALMESCKKDVRTTRAVILCGGHSFIHFTKGASLLTYSEAITPTLKSDFSVEDIDLHEKGNLPIDPYPPCWDDLDWKIYDLMRDPNIPFRVIGEKAGVSWKTVETRFKKIRKDCKTVIAFFPKGYKGYWQTFVTFETEYEVNLRDELQKLDRTTYIYKVGNTVILNLFLDDGTEHYAFLKLKKEGLITNLKISIPVHFWTPLPL